MSAHAGLPQLGEEVFLTDGGMETTLIFRDGFDLPDFAAFTLLADPRGEAALRRYYASYLGVAEGTGRGLLLDTATWRASSDWGARLGYGHDDLAAANRRATRLVRELRDARSADAPRVVVNGAVGPRGDGYRVDETMSVDEAERYHRSQVAALADGGAELVTGLTMTYAEEAAGIARAAADRGMPAAVSFTVETDGRLPNGQPLADAIEQVDAEADRGPAYFMINCAHPWHFADVFDTGDPALDRIRGIRANASARSHAELDEAEDLDDGDPVAFALEMLALRRLSDHLTVLGGCCGTDHRHIGALASAFDAR